MALFGLTKKTDYGLAMLAKLTKAPVGSRVSLTDMAEMGWPRAFMANIAKVLVESEIIDSKEGRGGGYALAHRPDEIKLRDVLEAMEGELRPVVCSLEEGICPIDKSCSQRGFMARFTRRMEEMLGEYTVKDLIKDK